MACGRVVGGIVVEKNSDPPEMCMDGKLTTVIALLEDVERPLAHLVKQKKDVPAYRVILAATDPEYRNSGVLTTLATHLWQRWRPCIVFTSTSSEYSRRAALSGGMTELHSIAYAKWKLGDEIPFASVKPPHTKAALLYYDCTGGMWFWTRALAWYAYKTCTRTVRKLLWSSS